MMDQLKLNGIEVECIIGDQPEERESEQRLLVDVALDIDLADAAESDRLDDTVDYALLVGSGLLFVMLALLMKFTGRINRE